MLRGEIVDYSRAYRTCEDPNAMLVDAVARREQRRGRSSDAQEQSAVGSVERIRQAVEKRDELHEETHREAPDD